MIHEEEIAEFNKGVRSCILITKSDLRRLTRAYKTMPTGGLNTRALVVQENVYRTKALEYERYLSRGDLMSAIGLILGYPPKCVEWFSSGANDRSVKVYIGSVGSLKFVFPENLLDYVQEYFEDEQLNIRWWHDYQYLGTGGYLGVDSRSSS